ncbi:hypothetical protein BBO99_00000542 [Phytophthora kernoviae]|uniref:Uncharacterized protein n=1 Tax=Phytophthora kernoviae TaxID=325452 RepID=A0A421H2A3_9STRA|nr:hypothetical protein BBI17_000581 [Phytophthora kernoviae]RLN85415.1 hypothetical protein BBO99_00000542 [Phytophthora kernoviae]
MYMDSDFEVSICLIYVEDVDEPGSMAQGSWEFLLSPEATRVELINFTRRVKGGMDLPEPMVRKLCSDVLTSLVRDLTLLYFPYELALAFNLPPAKLDIKGELQITGQPIDDVMEKELKELDLGAIREAEAKQKLRRQATATEKNLDELQTPLSPILGAAANAALMFSSLLSGSDKKMQAIAKLLELSSAQFNLLVALKNCRLFPSTHNFHSLASICAYFNAFSIDEEGVESKDNERRGQEEKLRATWKRILELIYIQRMQTTGVKSTTPMTPKVTRPESEEAKTAAQVELFDMDKFFDLIKRLSKKPASVQVSVKHFYCTLNALNVVEALSKLYERVILGIDYRKPRTGADGFIYGIRLGRKASQQPAMAMAAAAVAASAAANADDELYPVGSPPVLDLRRYRPAEISFRTRVQTFSKFWQSLKKVIEFVRENIDDVSVELAGNLKGTCDDCVLNGSFKDAEFRGPLSMGLAIPPCFLGFYRAEVISLGNDRVGMQVDAMLPSTSKTVGNDVKQQNWVFTTYVRPQMLRAFPQHQMLFDAAQVTLMQLLRSAKLEMNFDVMARAFIHEDESLMVTLCGSPLHPMPLMYRDEVNLLDIILQVDDLTNIWIDDRYPPYSNPLYF